MSRSDSGRIVVDLSPRLKQELYRELQRDRMTLKTWLILHVQGYLQGRRLGGRQALPGMGVPPFDGPPDEVLLGAAVFPERMSGFPAPSRNGEHRALDGSP